VEIITRGTGVSVGGGVKVDMIERMKKIERGKKKKTITVVDLIPYKV
jgi:hypothetical protein